MNGLAGLGLMVISLIATALDYASYRAGHINWQERAPKLAKWFEAFQDDPHYKATYGYPKEIS